MKKRFLLFLIAEIFFCSYGYSQQLVTGNLMRYPRNVLFINEYTGYVLGSNKNLKGEILKTTDGSKSWTKILEYYPDIFTGITFPDINKCIVIGTRGLMFNSTDGGRVWENNSYPTISNLSDIIFLNNSLGYIVGGNFFQPIFLKTINGGNNWISLPLNYDLDLYGVDFYNENYGIAVGNGIIIKTTDGGNSFSNDINQNYGLTDIDILDSMISFAAGIVILKSENGGNTWNINYDVNLNGLLNKIKFINSHFGISVGNGGLIIKTTDSGVTWEERSLKDDIYFYNVYFINNNTGWVIGYDNLNGLLYKTTDAGINWTLQNTLTEIPNEFSLLQNYPNPFNPKTMIRYKLNDSSLVNLKIYDINGKLVLDMLNDKQEAGVYEAEFDGSNLSSGIYLCHINVTTINTIIIKRYNETKKMILLK